MMIDGDTVRIYVWGMDTEDGQMEIQYMSGGWKQETDKMDICVYKMETGD